MQRQRGWVSAIGTTFGAVAAWIVAPLASAGEAVSWSFSESTTGQDVFWTSPTAVNPAADVYDYVYEIVEVKVDVQWGFFTISNIDVTDEIDPELLTGTGTLDGPLPIVLADYSLAYPPPPDEPGVTASVFLALDADGFGILEVTDVFLGDVTVDLGPPFGEQVVTVKKIQVAGTVGVTPADAGPASDLNGDGVVDGADLGLLLGNWGGAGTGDLNGDGVVDGADLGILLGDWS